MSNVSKPELELPTDLKQRFAEEHSEIVPESINVQITGLGGVEIDTGNPYLDIGAMVILVLTVIGGRMAFKKWFDSPKK